MPYFSHTNTHPLIYSRISASYFLVVFCSSHVTVCLCECVFDKSYKKTKKFSFVVSCYRRASLRFFFSFIHWMHSMILMFQIFFIYETCLLNIKFHWKHWSNLRKIMKIALNSLRKTWDDKSSHTSLNSEWRILLYERDDVLGNDKDKLFMFLFTCYLFWNLLDCKDTLLSFSDVYMWNKNNKWNEYNMRWHVLFIKWR